MKISDAPASLTPEQICDEWRRDMDEIGKALETARRKAVKNV